MSDQGLLDRVVDVAAGIGIFDVGVADPSMWGTDPLVSSRVGDGHRPRDIMPDCRSVIVLGVPVQRTILDTAPSIYYNHLYGVVNNLLDQAAERVALELCHLGFRSVYVPRDGYHGRAGLHQRQDSFFSHRHAAYLAGMGTFGWNNMLLTEAYGPRIRLVSVITEADLPKGEPMGKDLCIGCGRCTRQCPASAVAGRSYPEGVTDKPACVGYVDVLAPQGISPCGRCIAVCPVGNDGVRGPTDSAVESIRSYRKPIQRNN